MVGVEEVGPVEDSVVEDERLGEEHGVDGLLVLGVLEMGDAGGDLANLPAAEACVEEVVAVLLLHPPGLGGQVSLGTPRELAAYGARGQAGERKLRPRSSNGRRVQRGARRTSSPEWRIAATGRRGCDVGQGHGLWVK